MSILNFFFSMLTTMILILLSMAFFTLLERKILGYSHLRKGPNKVSLIGLMQPIADAMKLFIKQITPPSSSNKIPYLVSPCLGLFLALSMWILYPFTMNPNSFKFGILMFLAISSVNVYATLLAGWTSNSKYSLLGALRGSAQTISYEVTMALTLLTPLFFFKSLNFTTFTEFSFVSVMLAPVFVIWFITLLAETNRTPFDLAEGESELVSGFNTEYSSGSFALIFMAEYTNILVVSLLSTYIFCSMSLSAPSIIREMVMVLGTTGLSAIFVWTRTTFPRMRYDQLMYMAWKSFLPFIIATMSLAYSMSFLV